ncbi:unnamed protein product [Aphanomyces euteiches]
MVTPSNKGEESKEHYHAYPIADSNVHSVDGTKPGALHATLEAGLLREDETLVYNSQDVKALVGQYVVIGFLYGALPYVPLGVLNNYYELSGSEYNAPAALISLFGWSLKAFVGLLSDAVPIMGYRRKSYMLGGWVCCGVVLLALTCLHHGSPSNSSPARYYRNDTQTDPIFRSKGTRLGFLCALATFCYAFADVPADALVVEYAQSEPDEIRGRLQTIVYSVRSMATMVSTLVILSCLSSDRFRGDFSWDMGLNVWFAILCAVTFIAANLTFLFVNETKRELTPLSTYATQCRTLLETRSMWQLMAFNFLFNLFANSLPSVAPGFVQMLSAATSSSDSAISTAIGCAAFAATVAAVGKWGKAANWRVLLVATTLILTGVDAMLQFLSIYDVVRSKFLFIVAAPLASEFPRAVQFILTMFTIVQIADQGNEGLVFGTLTTCSNMASPIGTMLSNILGGVFHLDRSDIKTNDFSTFNQFADTFCLHYAFVCVAVCFVGLYPTQKKMLQEWKATNDSSKNIAVSVILAGFVLFIVAVVYSFLTMFKSTLCLRFVGGRGC